MTSLWTAFEAAAATGGQLALMGARGPEDIRSTKALWTVGGLSIDTRTLGRGDLFVALADQRDGHEFLGAAKQAGAAAALVSHLPAEAPHGLPLLKVGDTQTGLEALATAARDRCFGKLVAVTGSAGKTSTKELLRAALSPLGQLHAARASFNNHIGVPLTLATLPANADFGVFEIGMSNPDEIRPLSRLVRPHAAIITTIAEAHLENFDNLDGIADAKAEILEGIRPGGAAILPADSPYYERLARRATELGVARVIPFGSQASADAGARLVSYTRGKQGAPSNLEVSLGGRTFEVELHISGRHQAMNATAVLAAAFAIGADLDAAIEGLATARGGAGRGAFHARRINGGTVEIFDESYNANPASMAAALSVLGSHEVPAHGRRIAVLGGMKELGPESPLLHAGLAKPIADAGVDLVFTAGEEMDALRQVIPTDITGPYGAAAADLLEPLLATLKDGDAVLFKGSNASKVGEVLAALLAKTEKAG